jgi:hypothetical protein
VVNFWSTGRDKQAQNNRKGSSFRSGMVELDNKLRQTAREVFA